MKIEKKHFTETKQIGTFRNYYGYGEVTEYSFTTTRNLTEDAVDKILEDNGIKVFGIIFHIKQEIDYSIEQMARVFKYVVREVEYV
jgi:hypothetical protein